MLAWGKYDKSNSDFHCLEHHCADVAACFEALIREPIIRHRFACAAGLNEIDKTTESRLAVIAFLHDFAKLNSGFQFKVRDRNTLPPNAPPKSGHIGEAFYYPNQLEIEAALQLTNLANSWGEEAFNALLLAALSHHGWPPSAPTRSGKGSPLIWKPFDGYVPVEAARRLHFCIDLWFPEAFRDGSPLPISPPFVHQFAGLVAIADQVGSSTEYFKFHSIPDDSYIDHARIMAEKVMRERGFIRSGRPKSATPFVAERFLNVKSLRPMQKTVKDISTDNQMLILESETGSGKTEAALIHFANLWDAGIVDGLYFAVPTRAAAKQLHARIDSALQNLFRSTDRIETVLALPGYIRAGSANINRIEDYEVFWEDEPDEELRAARWSAERDRTFLCSTAAVGTIDQALLGSLKVKWAHFRSSALARSLLVVDEVHASDTYMTEILRRLLHDHIRLGGKAILMSATLGAVAKTRLINQDNRFDLPDVSKTVLEPYPTLTLIKDWVPEIKKIENTGQTKCVKMRYELWLSSCMEIAKLAISMSELGAKVLVIRNTVSTAQAVARAIISENGERLLFQVNGIPTLHHSRFATEDRHLLDMEVENLLGKNRTDEGRIIVGTQTLEQSLDIDADFLITDICPIDVLLQRIGRLHRHDISRRPPEFRQPCCVVLGPIDGLIEGIRKNILQHGIGMSDKGGVYRNVIAIELTRQLIQENQIWKLPHMNRYLVEQATHPSSISQIAEKLGNEWLEHEMQLYGTNSAELILARNHSFCKQTQFEDLEFSSDDDHIRTRLGEDGPRILLDQPLPGPFFESVRTFNFPMHLLKKEDKISEFTTELIENHIRIKFPNTSFRYDYLGLQETGHSKQSGSNISKNE